jgi:AsmA protein
LPSEGTFNMSSTMAKRILPISAIAIVVILAIAAALPYLASTNLVRDRIAQQIGIWSGYKVEIAEAPEIQVFPSLKAVLRGVSLYQWGRDDVLVMQAERVEAGLSLIAAFRGNAEITDFTLVRPHFLLAREADGSIGIPLPQNGKLYNAIKAGQAAAGDGKGGAALLSASPKLGTFTISDGWISVGPGNKGGEMLTSIDGTVDWPSLAQPLSVSGKAIWHGETVELKFATSNPVSGLSLKEMPVTFSMKSAPVNASFSGTANFLNGMFLNGNLEFSTPSAQRALTWYGMNLPKGDVLGALTISGTISGNRQRLKFEKANVGFGEHKGTGVVDFRDENGTFMLGGTLAFNSLDILSMLGTFGEIPENGVSMNPEFDTVLSRKLQLDLRLSASEAGAGPLSLTNVATNIQVTKDLTAIDIAGAQALGGRLQAGLRFDRKAEGDTGEVRILANDISGQKLFEALGIKRFSANAPLMLSVIVRGPAKNWRKLARGAHGTVSVKFGAGSITGFDIAAFAEKLKTPEFFALSDTANNPTKIKSADFKLAITEGIGRVEQATIRTEKSVLSLTGLLAPFDGSVALAGKLVPEPDVKDGNAQKSWSFFMGGTPQSPFVSPVFQMDSN